MLLLLLLLIMVFLCLYQVSDVGPVPDELCEGQVITVEPGVYFMPLMLEKAKKNKKQVRVALHCNCVCPAESCMMNQS